MADAHEEPLNVYDRRGRVIGQLPRQQAKASGRAVGAVQALIVNARGEVLLQCRPLDKENGGRWDKSVGGHVGAGETFDATVVREAGEELFDDGASPRVTLLPRLRDLRGRDPGDGVLLAPAGRQLNLRDVRLAPGGSGLRTVVYHVAIYLGRTSLGLEAFRPQASEIDELAYRPVEEVDALLARGELAPNMAFLWLARGREVLGLARRGRRAAGDAFPVG